MKRFEVVQNIPSPYRLHLFNVLWREVTRRGYELHVNFMSQGHAERPESWRNPKIDFPHTYWRDYGYKSHHFNPALIAYLRKIQPDVMLVGSPFDTFTSIAVSWLCPAPIRCAWVEGQTKTPGKMTGPIGWFKRFVFSRYPFVGVPGADAARYFELHQALTKLKMPTTVFLPNLIDEGQFRPRAEWPKNEVETIRLKLGVGEEERMCLIPARLTAVKGLVEFVSLLTPGMVAHWKIVIVGGGSLKEDIINMASKHGVADRVVICDYLPYAKMPLLYAAADLFLLPSRHDPNPLSVIEALHSGLPIALSDRAGNVEEAVTEGKNGWKLSVLNAEQFEIELLKVFSASDDTLRSMGDCSRAMNAQFWESQESIKRFCDSILES